MIGPIIAALLTLMIFSYIFGDNVLFKLATHIFVGVAIGYAIITIWYGLFLPILTSEQIVTAFPALILCFFLLFKIVPSQNKLANFLGNIPLAWVLGVGAALTIGGALFGTLWPQIMAMTELSLNPATADPDPNLSQVVWLNNIIIVLGTIGTLFYFTFAVKSPGVLGGVREGFVKFWAGMGRLMIIFTLGALFANTVSSRVAILISRLQFLANLFGG